MAEEWRRSCSVRSACRSGLVGFPVSSNTCTGHTFQRSSVSHVQHRCFHVPTLYFTTTIDECTMQQCTVKMYQTAKEVYRLYLPECTSSCTSMYQKDVPKTYISKDVQKPKVMYEKKKKRGRYFQSCFVMVYGQIRHEISRFAVDDR